jgi:two-component system, LytTR family, response regulator
MLRVLIIDDEPPAHDVLLHHCRQHDDIEVVGHCYSAGEALAFIETKSADMMFLDIRMPLFGGLDLLRGLKAAPPAVIVSAYQEHALEGFELDVVDYLVKPVSTNRFSEAIAKVRRRLGDQRPGSDPYLVLKVDRAQRRFLPWDIEYFEAQGNFVKVWMPSGTCLATTTLKNLIALLPSDDFVQVHRSYIVNRNKIVEQQPGRLRLENGREVPVGKKQRGIALL